MLDIKCFTEKFRRWAHHNSVLSVYYLQKSASGMLRYWRVLNNFDLTLFDDYLEFAIEFQNFQQELDKQQISQCHYS